MFETDHGLLGADERDLGAFVEQDGRLVVMGVAIDEAVDRAKRGLLLVEMTGPGLRKRMVALRDGGDGACPKGTVVAEVQEAERPRQSRQRNLEVANLDDPGVAEDLDDATRQRIR